MEKVRRQHYVPRMYLKRFGYGNIGDEYISVLKLDNGTVLDNRKVENFAVANYFYDADKEQIAEILKEDLKVFPELCDNENLSDDQFTEHVLARERFNIFHIRKQLSIGTGCRQHHCKISFSLSRIALNDCQFSKWNIRKPQPIHAGLLNIFIT